MAKQTIEGKRIELFETCLELKYSVDLYKDWLSDMADDLKNAKKRRRRLNHLLKKAEDRYELSYGRRPGYK